MTWMGRGEDPMNLPSPGSDEGDDFVLEKCFRGSMPTDGVVYHDQRHGDLCEKRILAVISEGVLIQLQVQIILIYPRISGKGSKQMVDYIVGTCAILEHGYAIHR